MAVTYMCIKYSIYSCTNFNSSTSLNIGHTCTHESPKSLQSLKC